MNLAINDERLKIGLSLWEKIWAAQFNHRFEIPLTHIEQVSAKAPQVNWWDVRLPGTLLPGVIKAGTYYTNQGREFWYVTSDKNFLTLELSHEFYQKVVLTIKENEFWIESINRAKANC